MQTNTTTRLRLEGLAVRLTMIAIAITLIAVGVTLLTWPLAVPVTVGLWLGAAGLVFLGVFADLPDHG
jgi:uncharacterized membrane protein HdeD (DUF308 family)